MSSYHHFSLFPMAIFLVLVIVSLLILPLDAQTNFQVKLRHVDTGANLTKLELLHRALKRDEKRFQSLYPMALAASRQSIETQIHPANGEYLMDLSIGTPQKPYLAVLDTGSDLIWTQCTPCKLCFHQPDPIFDPTKSSSFSKLQCSNNLCTALSNYSCGCSQSCEYLYQYSDKASTQGFLAIETLGIGKVSVGKVVFGCGINNTGKGFHRADGLVGLGRGPLSLVSQLNVTMFSYCLPSIYDNKTGTFLMGSSACGNTTDQSGLIKKTTPMIRNPKSPSLYYLSLEGITVGHIKLPIKKSAFAIKPDGTGGMIIDSGTTITYIEKSAYNLTKREFIKQVKLPVVDKYSETGLDLCFNMTPNAEDFIFPKLIFHFKGVDLALPQDNYILELELDDPSGGVAYCLAIRGSWLPFSTFGNIQQQNIQVIHNLKKETLTFLPKENCDQL